MRVLPKDLFLEGRMPSFMEMHKLIWDQGEGGLCHINTA
jgi:hypothetical protein